MSTYLTLHRSLPDSPPLHPRAAHGDGGCCCCFLAHNKPPWENPMHPSREPLIWSGSGAASHHHHHQAQPQMVTYSEGLGAAERLRAGFRTFRRTIYDKNPMLFARLKSAQSPKYMVFACSDSRVCPSVILDLKPGEAFTVRDIAGLVLAYHQNMHSSVVSAIEFAVTILKMTIELRLLAAPSSSSWSLLLLIEEGLDMGVVTDGYLSNRNHILVPGGS